MKILLCQVMPRTGDLTKNVALIQKYYRKAQTEGANLCIFPELTLTGYLAEDLFLNPSFVQEIQHQVQTIVKNTDKTCLLIPTPILKNHLLYNGVIVARNGKIIGQTFKNKLPNYGIFDENRYFVAGDNSQIFSIDGLKFGIPICEDIWSDSICNKLKELGAEILISINASPFENGKMIKRVHQVKKIFNNTKIPIIYCNQVAAQDGIIFDGKSFYFDGSLNIIGQAFKETIQMIELTAGKLSVNIAYNTTVNPYKEIYQAMVMGVKSYVQDNNFSKIILGLSGGIDSAMVAAIAVDALGFSNVSALMLPSKFTSKASINDAKAIAKRLKICLKTIAINDSVECLAKTIDPSWTEESSIVYQNLQSRIRGVILMAESNKTGALLLTTGNKSEYATGYATIYGDMNGAFNPIKDVYKTELYALARYKNVIPQHILKKAPSAELTLNQKDSDSLPAYSILDKILEQYIEHNASQKALSQQFKPELVDKILKLVKNSEFKRRQSALGVKISSKNFEKDRRFPITNHYKN